MSITGQIKILPGINISLKWKGVPSIPLSIFLAPAVTNHKENTTPISR